MMTRAKPESSSDPFDPRLPRCPRCSYDLRGALAARALSQMTTGTCSECGLQFLWTEVLENQLLPSWSIERPEQSLVRVVPRTLGRVMQPWRVWRELRMSHRCRPLRILVPILILLLLVMSTTLICRAAMAVEVHRDRNATVSMFDAVLTAVLTPFSSESLAPGGRFGNSYPPPRRLHDALAAARGTSWNSPVERILTGTGMVIPFVTVTFMFQIACGLSALSIPITLRAMNVRRVHIVRITLLSLWLLAPPVMLAGTLYTAAVAGFSPEWLVVVPRALWWWLLLCVPILTLLHWRFASREYLRLPHADPVAGAIVFMGAAATGLAVYLIVQPGAASDLFYPLTWLRALPGLLWR